MPGEITGTSSMPVQKALALKNFDSAYAEMQAKLQALTNVLETQAARDPALENCWQRGAALMVQLQRWLAAENGAVQVAEGGNLLLLPGRVRDEEWIRLSKKLTQDGLAAKAAVEAKDSERMFVAGAEMFKTCKACHAKYVPALQPGAEPIGAPLPDWPADVKLKQEQFLEGKK